MKQTLTDDLRIIFSRGGIYENMELKMENYYVCSPSALLKLSTLIAHKLIYVNDD